ncbi:MAG: hypothetical protein ACREGB_02625, partial [Candidatus Saccharimonadales bacterium]
RRTVFKMGNYNPANEEMSSLLSELRSRLSLEHKHLRDKVIPISTFIGLSVVRVCVRDGHDAPELPVHPDAPRTERVASYAFAKEPLKVIPIKLHDLAHMRQISAASGLGSARTVVAGKAYNLNSLVHLPIAPEEKALSIHEAVASFAAKGGATNPYVALHSLSHGSEGMPQYIEQIVPRSSLTVE